MFWKFRNTRITVFSSWTRTMPGPRASHTLHLDSQRPPNMTHGSHWKVMETDVRKGASALTRVREVVAQDHTFLSDFDSGTSVVLVRLPVGVCNQRSLPFGASTSVAFDIVDQISPRIRFIVNQRCMCSF